MKQTFKKIISTPKVAIGIALVLALGIGAISTVMHDQTQAELFAHMGSTATSTDPTNASPRDLTLAFPIGGRIKSVSVKIGDQVKAGDVLASLDAENALGAINQAKAAYSAAQTAYTKLVNGASAPDIAVARVALNNAKNAYANTVAGQNVLVANALSARRNAGLVAVPVTNSTATLVAPVISGTYTGGADGTYTITFYIATDGTHFVVSGLESGSGLVGSAAVPLGTRGLYIQFPSNFSSSITGWTVSIPNTQSATYLTYDNAYQSALQTQAQAVALAQGAVDTAQAALDQKVAGARSEDITMAQAQVESTQGALQIAQGNYNNTLITAPTNGVITNVTITAGQIATPNTPAIELLSE